MQVFHVVLDHLDQPGRTVACLVAAGDEGEIPSLLRIDQRLENYRFPPREATLLTGAALAEATRRLLGADASPAQLFREKGVFGLDAGDAPPTG